MGLDNGVCVRRTESSNKIKELKKFEHIWDTEHKYDFEICYWRKCWNVRGEILHALGAYSDNDYEAPISLLTIDSVIKALKSFNAENWDDNGPGGSIWTWEEQKPHIKRHIRNLKYIKRLMKKYPNLEVYFYDSY